MQITSKHDARNWFINSQYVEWEQRDDINEDRLIDFVYRRGSHYDDDQRMVADFLIAEGKAPEDFGLPG